MSSKIDMSWVHDQLTEAKIRQDVGTAVIRLIEVWNTMNHNEKTLGSTLETFTKLASGQPLVFPKDEEDGFWVQAQPGQIVVSNKVRVKLDAFRGELGPRHNGRVCKVVGVRYGDIIVKSIDGKKPELDGTHYSPHDLEKFIPR
jgi:hypothetical protein